MVSKIARLLTIKLLVIVFLDTISACKSAPSRIYLENGASVREWYCPPEQVLFSHESKNWCAKKCENCPNGYCSSNKCNCFPGTQRDRAGVCGKICPDCENGWCSSASKCECNEGYTWSENGCVRSQSNGFLPGITAPLASPLPVFDSVHVQTDVRPFFTRNNPYDQRVHSPHHGHNSHRPSSSKLKHLWHDFVGSSRRMWNHANNNHPYHHHHQNPQHPHQVYPGSTSQLYPQWPQQTPSRDYPQQSPQHPLQDYPESPTQSNPQSPPQVSWRPGSEQSPQNPRPNPHLPQGTSSRFYPQQNTERPQTTPPPPAPELRPPQKPESPSQYAGQSSAGSQPESPSGFYPPPSPAGRPDQPYSFEKVDHQLGSSRPTDGETCQTDYLWDPETKDCIPYESAKPFHINPRAGD